MLSQFLTRETIIIYSIRVLFKKKKKTAFEHKPYEQLIIWHYCNSTKPPAIHSKLKKNIFETLCFHKKLNLSRKPEIWTTPKRNVNVKWLTLVVNSLLAFSLASQQIRHRGAHNRRNIGTFKQIIDQTFV